jgi:Family of unknown function (DUF5670)
MLWICAAILAIMWLLGFRFHIGAGFYMGGSIIHLLLVIAIVLLVIHFLKRGARS